MPAPEIHPALSDDATLDLAAPTVSLSIWQRPFVQDVLPLCASVLLHAAVIVAGIATYHVVRQLRLVTLEQVVVPEMAAPVDAGDLPRFGSGAESPITQPDNPLVTEADGKSKTQGRDLRATLSGGTAGSGEGAAELAIGLTSSGGGGRGFTGAGIGDGPGGPGGKQAMFGFGNGTGGPKFIGGPLGGNVRKVFFVLDATGSMMSSFDALRQQIRATIQAMRPPQSFNIVFINEANVSPLGNALLFVTPENKRKAFDYVDTFAPRGGTDPLPALEKAFAQKPELIYLFIDPTDFPDKQAVLDLVTARNAGGKIKLNVIAFEGHDPANEAFLKSLAEKTGGKYRFVTGKELSGE